MLHVFSSIKQRVCFRWHAFQKRVLRWIKPQTTSFVLGTLADVTRGKAELLAENALLRHQLIILHRQAKRPVYRKTDRLLLVLLARMVQTWKQALFLVQEDDGPSMASRALPYVLEVHIKSVCEKGEALAPRRSA